MKVGIRLGVFALGIVLVFLNYPTHLQAQTNDHFINAQVIAPNSQTTQGVSFATIETDEPHHGCRRGQSATGSHSVWFKVTLPQAGTLTITTDGSHYLPDNDTILSLYIGDTLPNLMEVACNDDLSTVNRYSQLGINLPADTYFIKVSNYAMGVILNEESLLVLTLGFETSPIIQPSPTPVESQIPPITPTQTLIAPTHPATSAPIILTPVTPSATTETAVEVLINGDFEEGLTGWIAKNTGKKDKLKCNKPDKTIAATGTCSFQFKGAAGKKAKLQQILPIEGLRAGDQLTVYASVLSTHKTGKSQKLIVLKVIYAEASAGIQQNGKAKLKIALDTTHGAYQDVQDSVSITSQPIKAQLQLMYTAPSGKARFDAVRAVKSTP